MTQFKEGDLVYFPAVTKRIGRVVGINDKSYGSYPIRVEFPDVDSENFTLDGRRYGSDNHPSLYLATVDNEALLNALHGIEFEPAYGQYSKVVRELLTKQHYVPCFASNTRPTPIGCDDLVFVIGVEGEYFVGIGAGNRNRYKYATPIDMNGNTITEA